jgi:hypothetical protein
VAAGSKPLSYDCWLHENGDYKPKGSNEVMGKYWEYDGICCSNENGDFQYLHEFFIDKFIYTYR